MERKCPNCKKNLEEIGIKDIYGNEIKIDKCPSGCGIWFDQYELYKAKKEEIEKIDNFFENFIRRKGVLKCPVCNIEMEKYRNPSFKIDFEIDYCKNCKGLWLDSGEAIKFKNIHYEKIKKLKEETKITLKPFVENFEAIAQEEERADKILKVFYEILKFFLPL